MLVATHVELMPMKHRDNIRRYADLIEDSIRHLNVIEHGQHEETIKGWTKNAIYDLIHSDYAIYASDQEGALCGVASMDVVQHCRIKVMYASQHARRAGSGSMMLRQLLGVAKQHHYHDVYVFSSYVGLSFYKRHGFVVQPGVMIEAGVGATRNYPLVRTFDQRNV